MENLKPKRKDYLVYLNKINEEKNYEKENNFIYINDNGTDDGVQPNRM